MRIIWRQTHRSLADEIRQGLTEPTDYEYQEKPRKGFFERMEEEAVKAGVPILAREFMIIAASAGVASFLVGVWLTDSVILSIPIAGVGLLAPRWYLGRKKQQRMALFNLQLEKALLLAADSMRAGGGLLAAVSAIAENVADPVGGEFRRVLRDIRVGGLTIEAALENMQARIESKELSLLVVAIKTYQQFGANLVKVFDTIAETLRLRQVQKSEIKTATAQTRASGLVIGVMPIGLLLFLRVAQPSHIEMFQSSMGGRLLLLGCVGSILGGIVMMRKMLQIEVD